VTSSGLKKKCQGPPKSEKLPGGEGGAADFSEASVDSSRVQLLLTPEINPPPAVLARSQKKASCVQKRPDKSCLTKRATERFFFNTCAYVSDRQDTCRLETAGFLLIQKL